MAIQKYVKSQPGILRSNYFFLVVGVKCRNVAECTHCTDNEDKIGWGPITVLDSGVQMLLKTTMLLTKAKKDLVSDRN